MGRHLPHIFARQVSVILFPQCLLPQPPQHLPLLTPQYSRLIPFSRKVYTHMPPKPTCKVVKIEGQRGARIDPKGCKVRTTKDAQGMVFAIVLYAKGHAWGAMAEGSRTAPKLPHYFPCAPTSPAAWPPRRDWTRRHPVLLLALRARRYGVTCRRQIRSI